MIKKYMEWFIIIWTSLLVLLINGWILIEFYDWEETIVAAIIAFVGAIFGGAITYLGVQKTLKHRDREIFLSDAVEKLMILEKLNDTYVVYLNQAFFYEGLHENNQEIKDIIQNKPRQLQEQLSSDIENIYKSMTYDEIEILSLHKKSLNLLIVNNSPSKKDIEKYIEKVRDIYNVFHESKKRLTNKYRNYNKEI